MSGKRIIQVEEKLPLLQALPLSIQHVFAMFGASVLVPLLFGINSSIVLFMNGFGTLLFIFLTKGKAPAYLGSSFAFLAPAGVVIAEMGFEYAQGGFVVVGLLGCLLAAVVWKFGTDWIDVILPPAAMGPVVALIGLELAGNTVKGGTTGAAIMTLCTDQADSNFGSLIVNPDLSAGTIAVFAVTLGVAVFGSVLFRRFLSVIPLLVAMICGYLTALACRMVDFSAFDGITANPATWFRLPDFHLAKFDPQAILTIVPVILVIMAEHIGHQIVTSQIVGRDLLKDPGLHRTLLGDNLSTTISGLVGSVPTTTYGENIGVMAVTGVYSVQVIGGAAILSILMAFFAPLAAFIQTIPGDVIGGITFLLYGMIGASGVRVLVDKKVDYSKNRNLILTSVIFVAGLSGLKLSLGSIAISGMTLAAVTAVVLGILFHLLDRAKLMND